MPADAPVRRLARRSLRVHALLIAVVVLATLQAGLLLSTGTQLLNEERSKIEYHFTRLDGTLREQERFLRQWRLSDVSSHGQPATPSASWSGTSPLFDDFALIESEADKHPIPVELGDRFLRFYGSFWSASHYPPPQCLLVDGTGERGLLAPVQLTGIDGSQNSPHHLRPAISNIHRITVEERMLQRGGIEWVATPWRDGKTRLLAVAHTPQDSSLWGEAEEGSMAALACLLDPERVDDYRQVLGTPVFQSLSLFDSSGRRLLGEDPPPRTTSNAWKSGLGGVRFSLRNDRGWHAVYHVSWSQICQNPQGPLIGAMLLALFLAVAGTVVLRSYRRSVIEPLRENHARLLESEAFSRAILDKAPVGLGLLRPKDGEVLLANALASRWLGEDHNADGWQGPWRQDVLDTASASGDGLAYTTPDDRHLLITSTPVRYLGEAAVLCLFIDLSSQREAEVVLEQARRAAEQANSAKSQFLATISHEIRTPLYGVLGTLELLELTPLSAKQQDYLVTIRRSSSTLMQLISDILDVSKAEAGQLSLEPSAFDPTLLTEDALDSYSAAATNKGLQFYACIDSDLPDAVHGDAARVRQILNNLISNALKFTDSGRVVVRVSVRWLDEQCWLLWQVTDTGIGIASEHQLHLFEPFFQANPGTDAIHGTGLGLAISAHLTAMMKGHLRVVSESGLGSSFTVELPLNPVRIEQKKPSAPDLPIGLQVLVRSSIRELALSLCDRLQKLGTHASVYREDSAGASPANGVTLDVILEGTTPPSETGPHVIASHRGGARPQFVDGAWQVGLHHLDAIRAALAASSGQSSASPGSPPLRTRRHFGVQVLVAEDNPINQAILRDQLEQLGCQAVVAGDGNEALSYWHQGAFALLLTDLNMPSLDGYGLARALRARGAVLPIHGATANADPIERQRCEEAGMQGVLVKPITLDALEQLLTLVTSDGAIASPHPGSTPSGTAAEDSPLNVPQNMRMLFSQSMQTDLDSLQQAIEQSDPQRVIQLLHRIRGALVIVGAPGLVELGMGIEQHLAKGESVVQQAGSLGDFAARLRRLLN